MTATPLSIRRNPTSTQDIEALVSSVEMMLLGNETMFFGDEEGSGENSGNDEIINTTLPTTTVGTTSRKPLLFTTVIQEVSLVQVMTSYFGFILGKKCTSYSKTGSICSP